MWMWLCAIGIMGEHYVSGYGINGWIVVVME